MLELDYTNVLEDAVGSEGLHPDNLEKAAFTSQDQIDAVESLRISGKQGFANLPFDEDAVRQVQTFAREHAYKNVLILGIGGSALGPDALDAAMRSSKSEKRLVVLDNIDPDFVRDSLETLNPADTLVNVIAKSGVTAETMASFAIVRKWMIAAVGGNQAREHFAVTTDPAKGDLLSIARQEKLTTFVIPENVGGRFSVLTPVGTLPAALLGLNIEALMAGAQETSLQSRKPFSENPALTSAYIQWALDQGR